MKSLIQSTSLAVLCGLLTFSPSLHAETLLYQSTYSTDGGDPLAFASDNVSGKVSLVSSTVALTDSAESYRINGTTINWSAYDFSVGSSQAHLTVTNASSLTVSSMTLYSGTTATSRGSSVVISGSGTSVNVTGAITQSSYSDFTIQDHAKLTAGSLTVARGTTVSVTGNSSVVLSGNFYMKGLTGTGKTAVLTLSDGALFAVGGTFTLDAYSQLKLSSGYLAVAGDFSSLLSTYLTNGYIYYYDSEAGGYQKASSMDDLTDAGYALKTISSLEEAESYGIANASSVTSWSSGYTVLMSVPEPSTVAMLAGGILLVGTQFLRRRNS